MRTRLAELTEAIAAQPAGGFAKSKSPRDMYVAGLIHVTQVTGVEPSVFYSLGREFIEENIKERQEK